MIASALRVEIERGARTLRSNNPLFSDAMDGPEYGRSPTPPRSLAPLLELLGRGARERTAAHLAHRAFFLFLAADCDLPRIRMIEQRCGIPTEVLAFLGSARDVCRDRVEETLDALDAQVSDPVQLQSLRAELREVIESFDRLCEEVARVGHDVHVSAA